MADPTLYVCGTPIGNLEDVSARLRSTLELVEVVYAEDTRRTATLLGRLGVRTPLRSLFVGNEMARAAEIIDHLTAGASVALVSDAGMPSVSDPGAGAVKAVRGAGFPVTVIPGPSAPTAAIALSGFGGDRFVFEGFLPRRGRDRAERLKEIMEDVRTVVLFASPNRLATDLADLAAHGGADRMVAVCRELTKLHEESWLGTLAEAAEAWADRSVKGEVTLVLAPTDKREGSLREAVDEASRMIDGGASKSEAARSAARNHGVDRRQIYDSLLGRGDQRDS